MTSFLRSINDPFNAGNELFSSCLLSANECIAVTSHAKYTDGLLGFLLSPDCYYIQKLESMTWLHNTNNKSEQPKLV